MEGLCGGCMLVGRWVGAPVKVVEHVAPVTVGTELTAVAGLAPPRPHGHQSGREETRGREMRPSTCVQTQHRPGLRLLSSGLAETTVRSHGPESDPDAHRRNSKRTCGRAIW